MKEQDASFHSFLNLLKKSRLLKAGFIFNISYFLAIVFVFLFFSLQGTLPMTIYTLDFQVFYEAGQMFLNSPGDIYTVNPNGLPFRYFPSFAAFMALFMNVPMIVLYIINITIMMLLNTGIVYFVYRVSLQLGVTTSTKNFEKTLLIVFITPQHIVNLILGQITQLAILLVIIALYLLQSSSKDSHIRYFWVGFLLGLASNLKPFFLVLMPFLVPVTFQERFRIRVSIKHLVGVMSGLVLTMLPNIIFFVVYPASISQFLQVNSEGLSDQHSTSLTRLLTTLFHPFGIDALQLAIIIILGGTLFFTSYIRFVREPHTRKNYVHCFCDMIFLILLVYPDSWFLFLSIWYAFLAPSMLHLYSIQNLSEEELRSLDLLWSGSNNLLAFFSFGIILHYLVLGFDPINPVWLVILYMLYHRLIVRKNDKLISSESELSLRV